MDVGEVSLNLEHAVDRLEGVVDSVGIVRPGSGVQPVTIESGQGG